MSPCIVDNKNYFILCPWFLYPRVLLNRILHVNHLFINSCQPYLETMTLPKKSSQTCETVVATCDGTLWVCVREGVGYRVTFTNQNYSDCFLEKGQFVANVWNKVIFFPSRFYEYMYSSNDVASLITLIIPFHPI